ncbi:uncharacterized protein A1O5_01291 [Cladophialophora psammophila CBS 110553]|uniref:PNPLA domain-containing protein n=1 Tax=Cladophialophora psammophila CBS 110553 TaxID=1182543 RepID=W9X963_9EURO|nr:uncharacterized protein A1O5_01291 [Cladophialophora psammophila CBS 110553]EXJ76783.1 hypothetical protein A1O5_01291 [Cladophialophora psammophila CBS 110553]
MATADEGPLRLLSLDGGGVRGLSSLIILKHLMQTVDADSPPKPCDYFDLIGGTSTGGLIAIMLGRLKMDIDTCIDKYLRLSGEVFQPKRRRLDLFGRGGDALKLRGRFSSKKLEEKIQEIVKEQEEDADALLKVEKSPKCKVFVCATRADTGIHTVLLRSYASRQVAEVDCTIWEAARATSAASGFFDPIKIGKFGEQFLDGATGANNPIEKVLEEARAIWPDLTERLQCIVSIGTGQPSLLPFGSNLKQVATTLINIATETENTAKNFQINHVPSLGSPSHKKYFRFNVAKGLEEVGLEEHERKAQIAATTKVYLETPETGTDIQTCAALLKGGTPGQ